MARAVLTLARPEADGAAGARWVAAPAGLLAPIPGALGGYLRRAQQEGDGAGAA